MYDIVKGVTDSSLHFPNIVNNDASFVVQAQRDIDPDIKNLYDQYERNGINFTDRMSTHYCSNTSRIKEVCPISAPDCDGITGGNWKGMIADNGTFAHHIHGTFL